MEQEISSGTMLGIVLIALAAVIGLGFGVFSIAKGVANEGTVGVQDNLGSVSESAYDDYNDKIVTGTMVKSAIANFKGKSCAILINTTAMDKEVVTYKEHKTPIVWKFSANGTWTGFDTTIPGGTAIPEPADGGHNYINYNALLGGFTYTPAHTGEDGATIAAASSMDGELILKDGIYNASGIPFSLEDNGKVAFDYSTGGMSRSGNCEYLNATAKFDANLIKDSTGTTLGIVFTQRAQ